MFIVEVLALQMEKKRPDILAEFDRLPHDVPQGPDGWMLMISQVLAKLRKILQGIQAVKPVHVQALSKTLSGIKVKLLSLQENLGCEREYIV